MRSLDLFLDLLNQGNMLFCSKNLLTFFWRVCKCLAIRLMLGQKTNTELRFLINLCKPTFQKYEMI